MNHQLTADPRTVSEIDRIGVWTRRVLWPDEGRLRSVRRAVGALAVVGTLIQIVVWLLVAVFSQSLDSPWWLIYASGGATAVASLWIVDELDGTRVDTDGRDR